MVIRLVLGDLRVGGLVVVVAALLVVPMPGRLEA
jgi:hypothetical protein